MKRVLFFLLCFLQASPIFPQTSDQKWLFQFVVPSNRAHPRPDREDPMRMEIRDAPFESLSRILNSWRDEGLLPTFSPVLYIYLPNKEFLKEHRNTLTQIALREFERAFPGTQPKIKFRITSSRLLDIQTLSKWFIRAIEAYSHRFKDDPQVQRYAQVVIQANKEAVEEVEAELQYTQVEGLTAQAIRRIRYGLATLRTGILATTRWGQALQGVANGPAAVVSGVALALIDPALEFYTVSRARKIHEKMSQIPFSRAESLPRAFVDKIRKRNNFEFSSSRDAPALNHAANESH